MTTNINPYQQIVGQPYLMNSVAQPQQQKAAQEVNAVKIELVEPKAYGSSPSEMGIQQPSYYTYPQTSFFNPNGSMIYPYGQPMILPSQQFSTMIPNQLSQPSSPVFVMPSVPPAVIDTNITAPPVISPNQVVFDPSGIQSTVTQQPVVPQPQQSTEQPVVDPGQEKLDSSGVKSTASQQSVEDVNKIIQKLGSNDLTAQFDAINEIAEKVGSKSPEAANFLSVDTFKGLASIINRDTTTLAAPTQEQTILREKAMKGEQLTPEERIKAEELAPQEIAEMNKQYALFTLAIMQKSYRDTVNKELHAQGMPPVRINELPEINLVINTIKNNPNALIRESAINALSHILTPEDAEVARTIFTLATKDADENVKNTATESLSKLDKLVSTATSVEGKN